jgi:hypothetical protein
MLTRRVIVGDWLRQVSNRRHRGTQGTTCTKGFIQEPLLLLLLLLASWFLAYCCPPAAAVAVAVARLLIQGGCRPVVATGVVPVIGLFHYLLLCLLFCLLSVAPSTVFAVPFL